MCGTAFEGNMNEVMEMQESMLVGITRRRIKKDKVRDPARRQEERLGERVGGGGVRNVEV